MLRPLVISNKAWRVVRVSPGDPLLIDRTGVPRLATTDPVTRTIRISSDVPLGMFDQVYLHEAAHAAMDGTGLMDALARIPYRQQRIAMEELLAWFLETNAIQVIDAVSASLGRPVCVDGRCVRRHG